MSSDSHVVPPSTPSPADQIPPPGLERALRALAGSGAGAADAFSSALAAEVSPSWRALAVLGRGLCHELAGSRGEATTDVNAAFELWADAPSGDYALALAALGRAVAAEGSERLATTYLGAARRLAGTSPSEVVGAVLLEIGAAAADAGDVGAAAASWREVLDRGGPRSRAAAAANLGRLAAAAGDHDRAEAEFEQALVEGEGPHLIVVADGLVALAAQAIADEEWTRAEACLRRALPLRQAENDGRAVAEILHDLGIASWRRGQPEQAARWFDDCRASAGSAGDDELSSAALRGLAGLALEDGRCVVALAYAQEAGLAGRRPEDRRSAAHLLRQVGERARADGSASLSAEAFRIAAGLLA